jgi:TolB-like protein
LRYFFKEYAFDTDCRELHRGADVVSIAPQVFDLLEYLIRNRERVVTKDDLISAVWNGRIVSDAALTTRLNAARTALGDSGQEQRLIKTLPRKGFRFVGQVQEAQRPAGATAADNPIELPRPALTLPDKPSIAVLPFQNMSGDPDQDYFADGMVDEITTALSRFDFLFVIARNSSFTYKGKAVEIKQVGRELGVRYVLEGSVRKAAGKVRIIGQLIDAVTGMHLWADQFEGDLSDIFALQDRITERVVSAIAPKMLQVEVDLALRRTNNLSAYDLCLRALPHFWSWTRSGTAEALRLASRALEIEPRYGFAAMLAGSCHFSNVLQMWAVDPKSEIAEGFRLIRLALGINGNDATALGSLGMATAFFSGDDATAKQMVDRAIALNPNAFYAWYQRVGFASFADSPKERSKALNGAFE